MVKLASIALLNLPSLDLAVPFSLSERFANLVALSLQLSRYQSLDDPIDGVTPHSVFFVEVRGEILETVLPVFRHCHESLVVVWRIHALVERLSRVLSAVVVF